MSRDKRARSRGSRGGRVGRLTWIRAVLGEVLPLLRDALGEQIDTNLARTAELVRPDADLLDARAAEVLEHVRRDVDDFREGDGRIQVATC